MKALLYGLLLAISTIASQAANEDLLTREVPFGQPIRLTDFGGPDIEIYVKAREMTHVVADIVDYTRMVPVVRATPPGVVPNRNDTVLVPARAPVRVEKKHGIPFEGGRYEMYLLFVEPASGISVYFLNSIARQNHDNVVVAVPKPAAPAEKEMLTKADTVSPLIPEMADWYRKLQEERRTLDTTDAAAVARFNQRAADYHAALEKTRAAREALKLAPVSGPR